MSEDRRELANIETQAELLEDVNCRLEEISHWRAKYPSRSEDATVLYCQGMRVGSQLKELGVCERSNFVMIRAEYKDFVVAYEHLWRELQSGEKVRRNSSKAGCRRIGSSS